MFLGYPRKMFEKCFHFFRRTYTPNRVFNDIMCLKSGNVEKFPDQKVQKQKKIGDTKYPLGGQF